MTGVGSNDSLDLVFRVHYWNPFTVGHLDIPVVETDIGTDDNYKDHNTGDDILITPLWGNGETFKLYRDGYSSDYPTSNTVHVIFAF